MLVIVNPVAGGGRGNLIWDRLEPEARRRLESVIVRRTERPGDAETIAREEASDGLTLVVGGDGTLHEAVNGLVATDATRPLGVIPAGSGNDFARNAGIPLDPQAALARLLLSQVRRVDLGRLSIRNGQETRHRVFLNSVSLGVTVQANRLAHRLRRVRPARLRYALGGLGAILLNPASHYRITSGAQVLLDGPALNLTVANGGSFGGGMLVSPGSSSSDGIMELIVLGPMGRRRALLALARLQRGAHLAMPEICVTPVREPLHISSRSDLLRIEADGQELTASGELTVEVLPARLPLLN